MGDVLEQWAACPAELAAGAGGRQGPTRAGRGRQGRACLGQGVDGADGQAWALFLPRWEVEGQWCVLWGFLLWWGELCTFFLVIFCAFVLPVPLCSSYVICM